MRYLGRDQAVGDSLAEVDLSHLDTSVTFVDPDQIAQLKPQQIVVGKALEDHQLMNLIVDHGARNVIQLPNIDFARQISFTAQVLSNPDAFFKDPSKYLLHNKVGSLLKEPKHVFRYPIADFPDRSAILEKLNLDLASISTRSTITDPASMVADEMLLNVIKDAPLYFKRYFPTLDTKGRTSSLSMAADDRLLLLWTEDDFGSLSVDKLLRRLQECQTNEQVTPLGKDEEGSGIGCYTIFNLSIAMSVFVKPKEKTVFSALLPLTLSNRKKQSMPKNMQIVARTF